MKINIEDLRRKNRPAEFQFQENGESFNSQIKIVSPLDIKCYVEFSEGLVSVGCCIKGGVELSCVRCLEVFEYDMSQEFVIRYCDLSNRDNSKELKECDMEEDQLPVDGILDISDLIRQQLLLKMPFRQLCKEDCLGLCQKCGTNLNQQKCNCNNE